MKLHKIYYVPGMISLILLPILCIWYLEKNKNIERCFEVSYALKYNKEAESHRFDTTMLSLPEYKRQYIEVLISNIDVKNNTAFEIIQSKLNEILRSKNKQLGIHIIFSDNSKYDSYIRTIDIIESNFKTHSAFHTYCPYNNNIWVLYLTQKNIVKPKVYPLNLEGDIVFGRTIKDEIKDFTYKNSNTIKLWPFFVIFVIFSKISIRYIKNKTTK